MKRRIPLIITFCVGFIIIISEFIPHKPFGQISGELEIWFLIISGFAILLGQLSLFKVNFLKIKYIPQKTERQNHKNQLLLLFANQILCGCIE